MDGVIPDHGPLNQRVIVHGTGFGDQQGTGYVLLGGHQIPVISWSAGAIGVVINPLAYGQSPVVLNATYPVQVILPSSGKSSNTVGFFLTNGPPAVYANAAVPGPSDQPSFAQVQRGLFCGGDLVTLYGSGFGSAQGTGYVSLIVPVLDANGNLATQEVAVPVISWSESAITFLLNLPSAAAPGTYTAIVHRGNGNTTSGSFVVGTRDSAGNCISHVPVLQVLPGGLSFTSQLVDTTSPPQSVTVTNKGTAPLTISSISTSPSTGEFVADTSGVGMPIDPNGTLTIPVTFTPLPADTGIVNGSLTIASDGGTVTVSLSGAVTAVPVGVLVASPNPLVFTPPQAAGTTSPPQDVTLSNMGTAPLTIMDVEVTAGPFANGPDCKGSVLNPGDMCMVPVTYSPGANDTGTQQGTLTITSDVGTSTVTLMGTVQGTATAGGPMLGDPGTWACVTQQNGSQPDVFMLTGSGFGASQGTGSVMLTVDFTNSTASIPDMNEPMVLAVQSWSDTAITFQLPLILTDNSQGAGLFAVGDHPATLTVTTATGQSVTTGIFLLVDACPIP